MSTRTEQLQIRVTPGEKATLRRLAREANQSISSYVLSRALPQNRLRFASLLRTIERVQEESKDRSFALAELNDFLTGLSRQELAEATEGADVSGLGPFVRCYVAAMLEEAAHRIGAHPPAWTKDVGGLEEPRFATDLPGLRLHLLRSSPIPFRRRNIFIDSSIGARV